MGKLRTLRINEIFGPTFQGEGPTAGQRAVFVRLTGCNLTCIWCDTPYTWDWLGLNGEPQDRALETMAMTVGQVADNVLNRMPGIVVITGGEPLLQQSGLVELIELLSPHPVEIETNGTIHPKAVLADNRRVSFNVSPKLENSLVKSEKRLKSVVLRDFLATGRAVFKFVATQPADLDEIDGIVNDVLIPPHRIWVMPEGTTSKDIVNGLQMLADSVIDRGWNLSPRLQVLTWEGTRGV